jgi:dihydrofolate reductase
VTRKIIFSAAMSLDGFIADKHDGYAWIKGDGDHALDTQEKWDYPAFLSTIDTVLMGRRCYELGQHKDFVDQKVIVASRHPYNDPAVTFTSDPIQTIRDLKAQIGKDVFVFGGANLTQSLLKENLIDTFIVGIVPIILGEGIRLFTESPKIKLHFYNQSIEEGIVVLHYEKRPV